MGKSPCNSSGVSPRYLPAIYLSQTISLYLLQTLHHGRIYLLCGKSRQVEERYGSPGEEPQYWPQLHWLQLPCHSQVELSSLNGLKVWVEGQKPHHNIAFLLVQVENAIGDRHYGLSIIWADPSQVRAASMEEAVGELTACTSSGTDWPYALVWLHEGTCHAPLPKEGHLGILPQRGAEAAPCWWISQLEVHQLLATSPQVIYP